MNHEAYMNALMALIEDGRSEDDFEWRMSFMETIGKLYKDNAHKMMRKCKCPVCREPEVTEGASHA